MKRFVKVCIVLVILFGVVGSGCIIAAVSMGAKLPSRITSLYQYKDYGKIKKEYSFHKENIKEVEVEVGSSDIRIVRGNQDTITLRNEGSSPRIRAVLSSDGKLEITQKRYGFSFFGIGVPGTAVLTIPEGVDLDDIDIDCGSGDVSIESVHTKELTVDCGSGDVEITDASAQEVGIDCGSGNIFLTLTGAKEDYRYDIDCGSGDVRIGSEHFSKSERYYENNEHYHQASKELNIDCGSGNVTVDFLNHHNI